MNVSLAFVEQGIGRAGGGFFGPSEERSRRCEIPFAEFAQPKRKIAGCLRSASNGAKASDKQRDQHANPEESRAFPVSPTSAGTRLVHRFAESDSHEHLSMFAQFRSANAPESPAPLRSCRAQSARACRSKKGNCSPS